MALINTNNKRSKHVGVTWVKNINKWEAKIYINGKKKHLGYFHYEKEAAHKYDEQAALLSKPVNFPLHEGMEQAVKRALDRDRSMVPDMMRQSKFVGVCWHIREKKWVVQIQIDNKIKHLGCFDDEKDAACKYDEHATLYNKPVNFPQHEDQEQAVKRGIPRNVSKVPDVMRRSKFVGVSWNKQIKKWQVKIRIDGNIKHMGYFDDEKEAACKYDEQATLIARPVNFPKEGQDKAKKRINCNSIDNIQSKRTKIKYYPNECY